jgi:hypothetical protein
MSRTVEAEPANIHYDDIDGASRLVLLPVMHSPID